MSVPGSRGGSSDTFCEGTPQFLVTVCGSKQSGHLVDGYEVWLSFTNAMGLPDMGTFANHSVGGLCSIKSGSTRHGRGCNQIHITKGDSQTRRQNHLHRPDCEPSIKSIS
jgi:hypothetical protein